MVTSFLILTSILRPTWAHETNRTPEEQAWIEKGFVGAQVSYMNEEFFYGSQQVHSFTHEFTITAMAFSKTSDNPWRREHIQWTLENVVEQLKETAKIYSQCNIKISRVRLVFSEKHQKIDLENFNQVQPNSIAKLPLLSPRDINGDLQLLFVGIFGPSGSAQDGVNPAYIGLQTADPEYQDKYFSSGYNNVAHEIGHVLSTPNGVSSNLHATYVGENLMSYGGGKLTEAQCLEFKNNSLVRPIIAPDNLSND